VDHIQVNTRGREGGDGKARGPSLIPLSQGRGVIDSINLKIDKI
jgi:hypothetical protein